MSLKETDINISVREDLSQADGMTEKVIKGSLWTLIGQILPLIVTFISTPFVIRFLGSESYGVLILVALIPNYFAFADFGMATASTKFGSEAFGRGQRESEGEIIRTAAFIAFFTSLVFAVPLFIFSGSIITEWFKINEEYQSDAIKALRITSITFVFGILALVFNTPMLARLRMDLNTLVNAVPKILAGLTIPIVLYFGGYVIETVTVTLISTILLFAATVFVSGKLLPELYRPGINKNLFKPLLKFGSGWIFAVIATTLLVNVEKFFLARDISVQSLAHYSVAFSLANMIGLFASSMTQSLIPAFAQILAPEKRDEFNLLFSRGIRINLIWILPALMFMFVVAKPFFTIWAGAEFGEESTEVFYILIVGLFFNILAYIPQSTLMAAGRTDLLAKIYWLELIFYIFLVAWMINSYHTIGAAIAWSVRVIADTFLIVWLARRTVGFSFRFSNQARIFLISLVLLPPVIFAFFFNFSLWLIPLTIFCMAFYFTLAWKYFAKTEEKSWLTSRLQGLKMYFSTSE